MATAPRTPRTPKASPATEAADVAVDAVDAAIVDAQEAAVEAVESTISLAVDQSQRVREQAEQTVAAVKEQLETVKTQFEKASEHMLKNFEELNTVSKSSADAFIKAGTIWAKGVEDLSKSAIKYAEASLELSLATSKSLFAAKTLRDVIDVQNGYAKTTVESVVGEMTRVSEELLKLSNAAAEPLTAQANSVLAVFGKKAA